MADFGVGEAIMLGAAVAGAGASVYSASQAGKMPSLPKPIDPNLPTQPKVAPLTSSMAEGDALAKSAGGTLLSKPGAVGDTANATRKTLLGS